MVYSFGERQLERTRGKEFVRRQYARVPATTISRRVQERVREFGMEPSGPIPRTLQMPSGIVGGVAQAGFGPLIGMAAGLPLIGSLLSRFAPFLTSFLGGTAGRIAATGAAGLVGAGIGNWLFGGDGDQLPPEAGGGAVAYTWDTGTATFYRLIDGRIAVQRKNGTWKIYRAPKHIVVPRNPKIGTLIRADKRTDRLMSQMAKRAGVRTRRKARTVHVTTPGRITREV